MNNLPEEDEEELESEKVSEELTEKKESNANGAHLSSEIFFNDDKNEKDPPANLIVNNNRVNGLKTETCI
jgi:hypothetical protein